jgi:hypothetical protein
MSFLHASTSFILTLFIEEGLLINVDRNVQGVCFYMAYLSLLNYNVVFSPLCVWKPLQTISLSSTPIQRQSNSATMDVEADCTPAKLVYLLC